MSLARQFADLFNEALKADPVAVQEVFKRVPHNGALNDHPAIVVGAECTLSPVGLINGVLAKLGGERLARVVTLDPGGGESELDRFEVVNVREG
jgi:hypothetical protein